MDLEKDDFRNVMEDARVRHAAAVSLICFTDNQALGLLRLYVTMGIATASGAAAGFAGSIIPRPLGWGLAAATLVLVVGSWFCIRAMRSGKVSLPGREPEFWQWASLSNVDRVEVLKAYLENLVAKTKINRDLNLVNGKAYQWAKHCSLGVPLAALLGGFVAAWLKL